MAIVSASQPRASLPVRQPAIRMAHRPCDRGDPAGSLPVLGLPGSAPATTAATRAAVINTERGLDMNMIKNRVRFLRIRGIVAGMAGAVAVAWMAAVASAAPLTVPFTETFSVDAANWTISTSGTLASWNSNGGPSGGTSISRIGSGADINFGSGTSGPILFRGQDNFDSSDDRFVGDWLAGGVGTFSVDVFHTHSSALLFQVRLASPFNSPGASSVNVSIDPNVWTTLTVPIIDSAESFQTYGALGSPPNATAFNEIFSDIGNIQIGLAPGQVGTGGSLTSTATFGLANPSITAVPEPGTLAALGAAAIVVGAVRLRRVRGPYAS